MSSQVLSLLDCNIFIFMCIISKSNPNDMYTLKVCKLFGVNTYVKSGSDDSLNRFFSSMENNLHGSEMPLQE